jgi:hypothetical protein
MTFKRKLRVACGQSAAFREERSPQRAQRNAEEETQNEKREVSLSREFFQYAHDPSAASQHKALALESGLTRVWSRNGERAR